MSRISILVPVYNEECSVEELRRRIFASVPPGHECQLLFVDDGSSDGTLVRLKEMAQEHVECRFLSLSRNFGHQIALKAGLDVAEGDCVIVMDGDLQHPPEQIPEMLDAWRQGFAVVHMVRDDSNAPFIRRVASRGFYYLVNKISDFHIEPGGAYLLLDRKIVDIIRGSQERNFFLPGLVAWLGFPQASLRFVPGERLAGTSKYSARRLILLALMGLTSSSIQPLRLAALLGFGMSFIALLYAAYAIGIKVFIGTTVSGWASLLASSLLIGGVQLVILGIVGEYIGRIHNEVKGRPPYVLKETSDEIRREGTPARQ